MQSTSLSLSQELEILITVLTAVCSILCGGHLLPLGLQHCLSWSLGGGTGETITLERINTGRALARLLMNS